MTGEHARPIDIGTLSSADLLRLVEEVHVTKQPRVLQRGTEPLAMLMPLPARKRARRTSSPEAVLAAVRATAGVWKGLVDGEQLKQEIRDAQGSSCP